MGSLAAWDGGNRITEFTDELGDVTKYTYNGVWHIMEAALAGNVIHNT